MKSIKEIYNNCFCSKADDGFSCKWKEYGSWDNYLWANNPELWALKKDKPNCLVGGFPLTEEGQTAFMRSLIGLTEPETCLNYSHAQANHKAMLVSCSGQEQS